MSSDSFLHGVKRGVLTLLGIGVGAVPSVRPVGRYERVSAGVRETGTTSGIDYLVGVEHADPAFFTGHYSSSVSPLIGGHGMDRSPIYTVCRCARLVCVEHPRNHAHRLFMLPVAVCFLVSGLLLRRSTAEL